MNRVCKKLHIIGDRIQERRIALSLTQEELAEKVTSRRRNKNMDYDSFVSIQTVRNWEQHYSYPQPDTMIELAEILRCDISYLYGQYDNQSEARTMAANYIGVSEDDIDTLCDFSEAEREMLFLILKSPHIRTVISDCISYIASHPDYIMIENDPHYLYGENAVSEKHDLVEMRRMTAVTHFGDELKTIYNQFSADANERNFYASTEDLFDDMYMDFDYLDSNNRLCSQRHSDDTDEALPFNDFEDEMPEKDERQKLYDMILERLSLLKQYGVNSSLFGYSVDEIIDNPNIVEKQLSIEKENKLEANVLSHSPLSYDREAIY